MTRELVVSWKAQSDEAERNLLDEIAKKSLDKPMESGPLYVPLRVRYRSRDFETGRQSVSALVAQRRSHSTKNGS
jgi:hypothetical protein